MSTAEGRAFLCALGLVDHHFRRVVGKDRSGDLRCPTCKHVYDPSIFDEPITHCPRDGSELVAPMTWRRVCACGAER